MIELSRAQVREVDRLAIQELGIPSIVLMENAGRNAAAIVLKVLEEDCQSPLSSNRVAVLSGGGNNGGDGYVIARHLANSGVAVTVFSAVEPKKLKGDAAANYEMCTRIGVPVLSVINSEQLNEHVTNWSRAQVIVDALLGTGFCGTVRPNMVHLIERCNDLKQGVVVAVDVPSGLDSDTGELSNATIVAHVTVTFVAQKKGFSNPNAQTHLGRVVVANIGTPPYLVDHVLAMVGDL